MSMQDKIAKVKDKAAKLAVKAAAVTTLMGGAGAVSSCQENNTSTDDNKDKVENVETEKTSVVFRSKFGHYVNNILLENGDELLQSALTNSKGVYLDTGDTVTYEGDKIKAVRYKGNPVVKKKVDFGKIGKIGKDITD